MHNVQVWENYEPADETATRSGADEDTNGHASSNSPRETVFVTVTEVVSGSQFYVQVCSTHSVNLLVQHTCFWSDLPLPKALVMHSVIVLANLCISVELSGAHQSCSRTLNGHMCAVEPYVDW